MTTIPEPARERLRAGDAAFARGEWSAARDAYRDALEIAPCGDALQGLSMAEWWLGDTASSLELRRRAFDRYVEEGASDRAGAAAVHLAAEYRIAGNGSLANGWFGRAQRLLADCPECEAHAWLEIELAKRAPDGAGEAAHGSAVVERARRLGRPDFEACGVAHVGLGRVREGDLDGGLALLDEAIATAVATDAGDPLAIGEACCMTLVACERVADVRRARDFGRAVVEFTERRNYTPLRAWCRTVYAEFLIASGRWEEAERELERSLAEYAAMRDRDRAPALAALAELRARQGRVEEAARLVDGCEDRAEALAPVVAVLLSRGDAELAAEKVEQRIATVGGDPALAAPLLALRARVALARGDASAAAAAARELAGCAARAQRDDLEALSVVLAARAARHAGEAPDAPALERAVEALAALELPVERSEARVELARALAAERPRLAVEQARIALRDLERLGAARHADEAAALLRELGAPGRPAPRSADALTRREREVLALLAEGLSNAGIAERLVISPKTAEHHVGRVLAKLDLRSRAEAAAYAVREGMR